MQFRIELLYLGFVAVDECLPYVALHEFLFGLEEINELVHLYTDNLTSAAVLIAVVASHRLDQIMSLLIELSSDALSELNLEDRVGWLDACLVVLARVDRTNEQQPDLALQIDLEVERG